MNGNKSYIFEDMTRCIADSLLDKDTLPALVSIHPTNICNLNCEFCYYKDKDRTSWLELDILEALFDDLKHMKIKNIYLDGGGEPLLHPDIEKIVVELYTRGINVGMLTNGTELQRIFNILEYFKWIRVSLDAGTPNEYAILKKCPKRYFLEVLDNLREIIKIKKRNHLENPQIGISFVITDRTYAWIEYFYRIASKMKIDYVTLIPDYTMEEKVQKVVFKKTCEILQKNNYFENLLPSNSKSLQFVIDNIYSTCKSNKCYYINAFSLISATGDVFPCSWLSYNKAYKMGSIKKDGFFSIWESDKYKNFRKSYSLSNCPPCVGKLCNNIIQNYRRGKRFETDESLFYML